MDLQMIQTGVFSIFPPIIAISLALITKEVYSSLFIGLFSGMLIYTLSGGGTLLQTVSYTLDMAAYKIAGNSYMIIFLGLLWAVIKLVSESGGSAAYGRWAESKLRSKRASLLVTSFLGILIFIDDGFNSLTVGNVMRPVTDRFGVSREKLAYIIDATAAPVCIIAPVSSWAVAVASELSVANGFHVFISTIPYNFYAILTIVMVFFISITGKDFSKMKQAENMAALRVRNNGAESGCDADAGSAPNADALRSSEKKGKIVDLVLPIVSLVICAILGMAYVGGFFRGVRFSEAIGYNPTAGLSLGAFAALVVAFVLYIPRKIMNLKEFINCIISGIGSIVPPMIILILSWSLGGVCRELIGTGEFVSGFVSSSGISLRFLPVIVFLIAAFMSFSMGTSWGTFGMLIPIVSMICASGNAANYLIPVLGATLAGSVYGDHASPISDTTIMSSTGAECEHIRHVETQLPYAYLVANVCAIGYLISGFVRSAAVILFITIGLLVAAILFLSGRDGKGIKASGSTRAKR